ncbi:Chromosome transmission fidelity protein 8-like protein [Psilocybe cubensis]|uniref:Chromosome transmission fidelity protein 8 n=2 Tax=Psilocybe cubensis TaxID=181762 RepID=A0A8H8CLT1_PSICU|nr:Chromosome transmission fidelity protein 8-like protein [Psilocybe cubensis]KAH9481325.1 Chromosome transmission fidelity protein 8-like protein [Psilocybe cubensis]
MIIPVTLASASTTAANPKLPPGLVKLSNDEIVLIELQGALEVDLSDPTERNGKLVGKLKMDEATNKPTLLIGHHLLEGKIAALPKPYAILVRSGGSSSSSASVRGTTTAANTSSTTSTAPGNGDRRMPKRTPDQTDAESLDDDADESMAVDDDNNDNDDNDNNDHAVSLGNAGSGSGAGWKIAGIVKKKIIFSKRPMPVIKRK